MGIGNHDGEPDEQQGQRDLITPHGDWEPGPPVPESVVGKVSLPLMGIGNLPRGGVPRGGRRLLITPHGDWEPLVSAAVDSPQPELSLPLMGIGNSSFAREWFRTTATSHYPSWGLGTISRP